RSAGFIVNPFAERDAIGLFYKPCTTVRNPDLQKLSGDFFHFKKIAGNSNPAVAPVVSKNVTPPKTSIDSIRTFFAAIKSGDFVTANALMGPALANEIAKVSNTSDTTKALSECKNNKTCNLLLNSFQPPTDGYKVTKYTAKNGNAGEQISFPLSKSSPLLASQIGDYNLDIFSEKYAGDIWVIQNVYIDGSPISAYF
nr:hypothetical protein [Patescibacteria group bacterium]